MPDATKWSPISHHLTSVCFPFISSIYSFDLENAVCRSIPFLFLFWTKQLFWWHLLVTPTNDAVLVVKSTSESFNTSSKKHPHKHHSSWFCKEICFYITIGCKISRSMNISVLKRTAFWWCSAWTMQFTWVSNSNVHGHLPPCLHDFGPSNRFVDSCGSLRLHFFTTKCPVAMKCRQITSLDVAFGSRIYIFCHARPASFAKVRFCFH